MNFLKITLFASIFTSSSLLLSQNLTFSNAQELSTKEVEQTLLEKYIEATGLEDADVKDEQGFIAHCMKGLENNEENKTICKNKFQAYLSSLNKPAKEEIQQTEEK